MDKSDCILIVGAVGMVTLYSQLDDDNDDDDDTFYFLLSTSFACSSCSASR